MQENMPEQDQMRPCPICRSMISFLAIRCKFCGAEVGRPRKEAETLTVQDLGGMSETTYTISGNVMDALEAFRAEEIASQEQDRRVKEAAAATWFGKRPKQGDMNARVEAGLPELDAAHQDLADSMFGGAHPGGKGARPKPAAFDGPLITRKLFVLAGIVAGLVILYLGTEIAWARIKDYIAKRRNADQIVYVNRALEMLNNGRPSIEALEEALEALKYNKTSDNERIAGDVRTRFVNDVNEILAGEPFVRDQLDRASQLVTRAALKDNNRVTQELAGKVEREVATYKLVLTAVEANGERATFRLHDPQYPQQEQKVGVGDYVEDRFLVKRILSNSVVLEDTKVKTKRGFRNLVANVLSPVIEE
jgi:hypothetical protein